MPAPAGAGMGRGQAVDADGFTLVQRRPAAGAAAAGAATGAAAGPPIVQGASTANQAAPTGTGAEAPPTAGAEAAAPPAATPTAHQQQQHVGAGGSDEADDPMGGEARPTVDDLRARYERCKKLVAWLEEEGYAAEDPVRIHAADQEAAAEQEWRGAMPGVAISKRLVSAEQALRRAKRVQAKQEQAISDHDQWYEAERAAMLDHLAELRARTRAYELRLAQISREAAQTYHAPGGDGGGRAEGDEIREAVDTLEDEVAPALREVLEMAPEGSAMRAKITEVMGAVSTVYTLATSVSHAHPARYDIASGAGDDNWQGHQCGAGYDHGGGHGGCHHYGYDARDDRYADGSWGGAWWHGGPAGPRWADEGDEGDDTIPMDTADVAAPRWMRGSGGDDTTWGEQAWKRGRWGTDRQPGGQGVLFRVDGTAAVDGRAAQPQANPCGATAGAADAAGEADAGGSTAAAPTPQPQDPAQQALERRKQEVWDAAQDEGVEVACDEIARMDAMQLEQWAATHIQGI